MDLSIIIVSFNTKALLKKCLGNLPSDVEIVIIDNGSTDGTVQMIKEIKRLGKKKIKLIENRDNIGFAKAVNQGLKQAKGEYLLLLNSDIFAKENALAKLMSFAKKEPQLGVAGGCLLNPDGSPQGSSFYLPSLMRAIKEFWLNGPSTLNKYTPLGDKPVEVEAVMGAVFLIPKKVLQQVGFFDERYFMYFEDLDYCRRVRKNGFKVYYLPEAKFVHEHGASGRSIPEQTHRWLVQSSKVYHGKIKYYLMTFIIWSGQKCQKVLKKK